MASTDFDVVIAGTKAKVLRSEQGGYRRRTIRREVEQQLLSQSETASLVSRADQRQLFQNSWAGGARWWKPLLGPTEADSFFESNHMDTWSKPGSVVPLNKSATVAPADNTAFPQMVRTPGGIFAVGQTGNVDATQSDVYKWTPASNNMVQETGYSSGVVAADDPVALAHDSTDGYVYVVTDGDALVRFNPATSAEDKDWITSGFTAYHGANVFVVPNQGIMMYDGEKLYTVDKSAPSVSSVFNDGLGPEWWENYSFTANDPIVWHTNFRLATATSSGIYYVKNVSQGEGTVPWVFRVDKDASGSWIGEPIATLPNGDLAVSIQPHLGSIVVACLRNFITNDTETGAIFPEVVLYSVDSRAGLSVIGSPLGEDSPDEAPFVLLRSVGQYLYFSGHKRLWVYDAARGGLHIHREWSHGRVGRGPVSHMAFSTDSAADIIMLFSLWEDANFVNYEYIKLPQFANPDTVAAFGDDETHYVLESNYFDFGLPFETKELSLVEIFREKDDGGSEWTVQVAADDGSFSDILVDSGTASYASATLSGTTGRRFRYKLIYQTKDTARKALQALKISATTGEMVTEWDLLLDGDSLLNVDNETQDEQDFYDNMVTLGDTATITTLSDNMQEQSQETDTGTTVNVKIQAVEIIKEKPGESAVRVVVREA